MAAVWPLVAGATFIKSLFIYAYRSTDFEVHRNWLAITHSLPISEWYIEDTSEWTLDYPPLFAWFEWLLSYAAKFFDPKMLVVSNLSYASPATIFFQRFSVIFTDFVYIYAIVEFEKVTHHVKVSHREDGINRLIIPILFLFNIGLFMVDHIHFQYNGMLFGLFILSIVRIFQENYMEGAFWFSLLLNMKHIFLYFAPAYFVYLLRIYCFKANKPVSLDRFSVKNFLGLGSIVAFVFGFSLGPFVFMRQTGQLLSRLFPFKRGLVHAYWAPNFWAFYSGVDKALTIFCVKAGLLDPNSIASASMTGGMVQEYKHSVLPSIMPAVTLLLTVFTMVPNLILLWRQPLRIAFLRSIILCGFSSFLFGWHVHEKAILMIIIPMTMLVLNGQEDARVFLILSITGFYSLFPLIFSPIENILKYLMLLISTHLSFEMLHTYYGVRSWRPKYVFPLLELHESVYIAGFLPLSVFNDIFVWLVGLDKVLPFLPLMLTSLYCSLGVMYCWIQVYTIFNNENADGFTERFWKPRNKRKKL